MALGALAAALMLLLIAAFPYIYAESGSASYVYEHRWETVAEVLGAPLLLWLAWWCARRSLRRRDATSLT